MYNELNLSTANLGLLHYPPFFFPVECLQAGGLGRLRCSVVTRGNKNGGSLSEQRLKFYSLRMLACDFSSINLRPRPHEDNCKRKR